MNTNNMQVAEKYYKKMLAHDFDAMADCLDENIHLISPLSEVHGRENVVNAARNLSGLLEDIVFNAKFSENDQVMFAYDFMFKGAIGKLRSAGLFEFKDGKITKINLFYDGRPFVQKRDEIFN